MVEPSAFLVLDFFTDTACQSYSISTTVEGQRIDGDTLGDFVPLPAVSAGSGNAQSAFVSVVVSTESSVGFAARFDAVSMYQQDQIFTDGFEGGSP